MKQRFHLAYLALLVLAVAGCRSNQQAQAAPEASKPTSGTPFVNAKATATGFDFYLLNLSWSPDFCLTHPTAIECATHATFVLHGLWPENNDGTYPENCSSAPGPADPSQYKDIYPDPGLLQHEWKTHGTCSGLGPDDFFSTARTAFHSVSIPPTLSKITSQISLPPDQILNLFTEANAAIPRSSLALTCGNNYLTAVEVCLDKTLHPISCASIRTCRANTVRIPPP